MDFYSFTTRKNIVNNIKRSFMSESWEEIKCEKCNTYNWYCIGDVGDLSIPDIDGTECYKCGHKE